MNGLLYQSSYTFFEGEEYLDRLHHILKKLIQCLVVVRFGMLHFKDHGFDFFMFSLGIAQKLLAF